MTQHTTSSLEAIAKMFEQNALRCENQLKTERLKKNIDPLRREIWTWNEAARILRETILSQTNLPLEERELEAVIDWHEQQDRLYYPDTKYPNQKRVDNLKKLLSQLKQT